MSWNNPVSPINAKKLFVHFFGGLGWSCRWKCSYFFFAVVIPQTLTISLRDQATKNKKRWFPKKKLARYSLEGEYIRGPDLESNMAPTWTQKDGPNAIWGIFEKGLQFWLIGSKTELGNTSYKSNFQAKGPLPDGATWGYYDGDWRTGIVVHSGKP